ncbi:CobW family GTP-binding protein [Mesobacillus harenae]|uniref:CobW family GTP-binding protein n=1 Tax=Mesobacillus harenae TaxID=2213203 RepID=UPI00157FD432|nr:GTP-binding protein [Mesobacillus harenae]
MNKTELYILSGFLGSGKTTLLKQLLQSEKEAGRKVAVMMNELGEISIDSGVVGEDVPLKELLDGCICCTIQDKLEAQLQTLLIEDSPDVIYIETTGAAHPVEVMDAVMSPLFALQLNIKGIITTLNGALWLTRRTMNPQLQLLIAEQVRHADLLLVNQADQLSDSEQAKISMEIQNINPKARTILTTYSKVSMKEIKGITMFKKEQSQKSHVSGDLRLSTFVHQFKKPVSQQGFEDFLRSLPDNIYRIKGYIQFSHSDYPDLFQYSYGTPLYMKEYMRLPLNMVFIGQGTDWSEIQAELSELEGNEGL